MENKLKEEDWKVVEERLKYDIENDIGTKLKFGVLDALVSNQVHSHQDERARSRKVDIISNEITDHASQSKSNKRDMGNPDDTNVSRGKEK